MCCRAQYASLLSPGMTDCCGECGGMLLQFTAKHRGLIGHPTQGLVVPREEMLPTLMQHHLSIQLSDRLIAITVMRLTSVFFS